MISGSPSATEPAAVDAVTERAPTAPLYDSLVALGAVGGAAAALVALGTGARGLVGACFLGALGALAVIDLRTHLLPNRVVLPAAAVVLILQVVFFPEAALEWVLASVGCFGLLAVLALVKPGGLGMGDAKLGLLLGAGLGMDVAMAMLIGCLALWPVAGYILARDGLEARHAALPLGPALALGAAVVLLTG